MLGRSVPDRHQNFKMFSKSKFIQLTLFLVVAACIVHLSNGQTKRKASQLTLHERVQQLTEMSHKRSLLRFNMRHFQDFINSGPRNYSVVVQFTALAPHRQCAICRHAHDEFVIVANSYRYANMQSNQLFFVSVDFDEGPEVFNQMRLNTAPVFIHFPPKGKPKVSDTLDIQRVGFSAEAVAKWISERTDVQIRLFRPPNYMGTIAIVVLFMLIAAFFYIRRSNLDFLYNKTAWAAIATVFCATMVSGQMWNHIRGPPFVHKSPSGGVAYIHGSSQGQFVLETYIVFILIGAITLGMIMMIEAAIQKGDAKKRRTCGIIGVVLVLIFYSLILSIFRSKAHGYPYSFLIK